MLGAPLLEAVAGEAVESSRRRSSSPSVEVGCGSLCAPAPPRGRRAVRPRGGGRAWSSDNASVGPVEHVGGGFQPVRVPGGQTVLQGGGRRACEDDRALAGLEVQELVAQRQVEELALPALQAPTGVSGASSTGARTSSSKAGGADRAWSGARAAPGRGPAFRRPDPSAGCRAAGRAGRRWRTSRAAGAVLHLPPPTTAPCSTATRKVAGARASGAWSRRGRGPGGRGACAGAACRRGRRWRDSASRSQTPTKSWPSVSTSTG